MKSKDNKDSTAIQLADSSAATPAVEISAAKEKTFKCKVLRDCECTIGNEIVSLKKGATVDLPDNIATLLSNSNIVSKY